MMAETSDEKNTARRRTVLTGVGWPLPVVLVGTAAPVFAASGETRFEFLSATQSQSVEVPAD